MRALPALLSDGLRLALLRQPRRVPLQAGFGAWLALALLGTLPDALWHWLATEPPRVPSSFGVQTQLAGLMLALAASAMLAAMNGRRALLWCVAGWLQAALLVPGVVLGALRWQAETQGDARLAFVAWAGAVLWIAAILLRLSWFLSPRRVPAAGTAAATLLVLVLPWFWLDAQRMWQTAWREDDDDTLTWHQPGQLAEPERTFYAQPGRLAAALDALAPQRPDRIDLYALAFGGDASEDVFRNEVEYVARLMPRRFDAEGRTLALLNHPARSGEWPLATATNLERALRGLGERMDPEQDVLFLYLTSHGSEEHEFYLNQPPLPLDQLDPARLRAALDASGIRWRVIVVSACYSGGFIEALRDPRTLVLTAARADRTSFGCGADSEITWFGKAFLAQALNRTTDFVAAHDQARQAIRDWEREEEIEASHPQVEAGAEIVAHLARWRAQFEPGPALPFEPAAEPAAR